MAENIVHARVDAIRRLARRRATGPLQRALVKSSASDVAEAMSSLTRGDTRYVFDLLPHEGSLSAEVLLELGEADYDLVIQTVRPELLASWVEELEPDDVADLIERLPEALRESLLGEMEVADREQAEELLAWPSDSAGGIMSPVAFRLSEEATCREAIEALQDKSEEVEMVFYAYIENDGGQLVGVTSLRQLLVNPPSRTLGEIMNPDVIALSPETDQEEVARIASRYDLLAVPIVDETRKFLGIVTIDDVLDVMEEEAAQDLLRMAGVDEEYDPAGVSVLKAARQRLTWLLLTTVGGIGLAEVIRGFRASLESNAMLAAFIPVIMALGGSVALQSATITVRNLATGHLSSAGGMGVTLFRELRVGLLIGLMLGGLLTLYGSVRAEPLVGLTVGITVVGSLFLSATIGALIPITLDRVGVDPALATGPFVTITIDVVAIVVYLSIATALFGL